MNLRLLLGGAVSAGVVLAADEFINRATKYEIDKYECTTDDCDDTSGEKDLQLLQTMMVITTDGQKSVIQVVNLCTRSMRKLIIQWS